MKVMKWISFPGTLLYGYLNSTSLRNVWGLRHIDVIIENQTGANVHHRGDN